MHLVFICNVQFIETTIGGVVTPIITLDPDTATEIPNWTPLGAIVVTVTITMSDASQYTGTPILTDPSGIYKLAEGDTVGTLWYVIVDPDGPGVGMEGGNTDTLTITAT